jgi:ribosomal-protein-alanine N-acetyltransferase
MRRADLDEILSIERVSFRSPWPRSAFDMAIAAPDLLSFVVDTDRVLGYLVGCPDGNDMLVANVAVCPDARRRGLGRRLLELAIERASEAHLTGCTLDVRTSNADAQRLYRGMGFAPIGIRPGYYHRPDEDAIAMRLELVVPAS